MNATLQTSLFLLATGAPLLAACLLAIRPWRSAILRCAPWVPVPALLLALLGPTGAAVDLPWLVLHTRLELDAISRVFLAFTSVLWLASGWYARGSLVEDANPTRFHLFFLLAMAGNIGLIVAADVPTFFAAFALMGIASAGLVFHRGDAESSRAGRMYLALAMLGEVLILAGLLFLTVLGGTTLIAELHQNVASPTASALLLAGFGIKAGALSVHFWLPLAHPAAPVPASAVLSGAMIKAGLLGWIRFLPLGETAMPEIGYTMIIAGLGAALLGPVFGVAQDNAKTVLAYSSISQMGIITVGLGIGAARPQAWREILAAVLIYATHHALAKGALFLGIGPSHAADSRAKRTIVAIGLLLPAVALAGAPFTSGALAKTALKSNLPHLPEPWFGLLALLLPLAAVGTTFMMVRFLWLAWPDRDHRAGANATGLWAPWLALVLATVTGVWLLPGALGWLPEKLSLQKIWLAAWPMLVGGGLAALGAALRQRIRRGTRGWFPAGDVGVLWEWAASRLRRLAPPEHTTPMAHDNGQTRGNRFGALLSGLGSGVSSAERLLRSGAVAGSVLLLLIGLLLGVIAISTD